MGVSRERFLSAPTTMKAPLKPMSRVVFLLLGFGASLWVPASAKQSPLQEARAFIEKKDTEQAVKILRAMYPLQLKSEADVSRVSQWLSVFLYDETVASFEKAVQLSEEKNEGSSEEFKKALAKEPHNKKLHQAYIVSLIDARKESEALLQIELAEQQYPYFKIFSVYKEYLKPQLFKEKSDLRYCRAAYLLPEEREFCSAVFIKAAAQRRETLRPEIINQGLKLFYPDVLFFLWEMTSRKEYLNKYLDKCRNEAQAIKQTARLYPGLCAKHQEVEKLLKPTEDGE